MFLPMTETVNLEARKSGKGVEICCSRRLPEAVFLLKRRHLACTGGCDFGMFGLVLKLRGTLQVEASSICAKAPNF